MIFQIIGQLRVPSLIEAIGHIPDLEEVLFFRSTHSTPLFSVDEGLLFFA